ncbi:MAG: ORF6N domain-containing protein [bacterium]
MNNNEIVNNKEIQNIIFTIRGVQVMLDEDIANLYEVETKVLNQAVKRNIERFPEDFMFQLTEEEHSFLRSQIVTSKEKRGGRRYLPYVFTEQGVAMLSAVIRSETAVKISIQIIKAFVAMRQFIALNARIFQQLDTLEIKQLETDKKIKQILAAMESKNIHPKQGIFYDGQIFDAYQFFSDIIRTAKKSIILIDNFVDDTVLTFFSKRDPGIKVLIITNAITKQLELDTKKFNQQYPPLEIKQFDKSHDRFLIIDETSVYHLGASLKDLGRKWFAFSKMDIDAAELLMRVREIIK